MDNSFLFIILENAMIISVVLKILACFKRVYDQIHILLENSFVISEF